MKIRGTDFVMVPVSSLSRAAAFYRDILGHIAISLRRADGTFGLKVVRSDLNV